MIVQLLTVFQVLLAADAARLKLPSKYANLVNELNTKAKDAGLGPIAEAVRDGFNLQDATNIQEIKSMEELKSIDEITDMKEIKSMQEIPDDVADKFIEDEGLVPIKSLSDPIPEPNVRKVYVPPTDAELIPAPSGCSAVKAKLRELEGELDSMMEDMADRIADIIDSLEVAEEEINEVTLYDEPKIHEKGIYDVPYINEQPANKINEEDIVNVTPIKNIQEIKSITPIKSIQEVVGIYALTDDQARKLKQLSG
jgi:hypothetical protein